MPKLPPPCALPLLEEGDEAIEELRRLVRHLPGRDSGELHRHEAAWGKRDGAAAPTARDRSLVPWGMNGIFPERNYGLTASGDAVDLVGMQLLWFDHWLKGENNGVEQDKPVKLFVMGLDHSGARKTTGRYPIRISADRESERDDQVCLID